MMRNDARTCSSGGRSAPTEPSEERRQDDSHDGTGPAVALRAALVELVEWMREHTGPADDCADGLRRAALLLAETDDGGRFLPSVTAETWSAIQAGDLRTAAALALLQADDARGAIALHDGAAAAEELITFTTAGGAWSWCEACCSYHHPANPTCRARHAVDPRD